MLDHDRAQDLAATSLDFDLTVEERVELDTHLHACVACRAHLDGLRLDARTLVDRPRADAPERVRRRVAPDPRPASGTRFRLAAALIGVLVVVVGIFAGTGGPRFGTGPDTGVVLTSSAAASGLPVASQAPATSQAPVASVEPSPTPATPAPSIPRTPWLAVGDQPAFDPRAATPEKDISKPPPPCGEACGDTAGLGRWVGVRAAVETDDGIVAVGYGCVGGNTVTCQADVWRSADGHGWGAVPNDGSLDAGSDTGPIVPTGMMDVVSGPRGIVAVGAVSRGGQTRATIWESPDGRRWQPIALEHDGAGVATAVAAGPASLVAVGRVRTDDGVKAAAWVSSDGTTWEPVAALDGAAVGRFAGDDQDVAGMFDVTWADDRYVAVGAECSSLSSCRIAAWTSPDGRSWSRATDVGLAGRMRSVAYLGPRLVAVGDNGFNGARGRAWTSVDAMEWIPAAIETASKERPAPLLAVVAVGHGAIAAGDGYAVQSSDGRSWTRSDDGALAHGTVLGLAAGAQGIIATGQGAGIEVDGIYERPPAIWLLPYR